MTLSTSTVTLAPGSSRTYTLAPGEAVTVATEPNCYVTVTETPDVISSADLDGQTNVRTSILQYKGEWTYGPYALGGTVVVAVSLAKSTSSVSVTLGSAAAAVVAAGQNSAILGASTASGVILYDGTMANGSNIINSASGSFRSSDVGKVIGICSQSYTAGTGVARISNRGGTILQVNSPTQIVVSFTAGAAYSGLLVVYGPDIGPALQAAITSVANSGGGAIELPNGNYLSSIALSVPNGVTLAGRSNTPQAYGAGASLGLIGYGGTSLFCVAPTVLSSSPFITFGSGATGRNAPSLCNINIDCMQRTQDCVSGVPSWGANIDTATLVGGIRYTLEGGSSMTCRASYLAGMSVQNVVSITSGDARYIDNYIWGQQLSRSGMFVGNVDNLQIIGNHFFRGGDPAAPDAAHSITMYYDQAGTKGGLTIVGNSFDHSGGAHVRIRMFNSGTTLRSVLIGNNHGYQNEFTPNGTMPWMDIETQAGTLLKGLSVTGNTGRGSWGGTANGRPKHFVDGALITASTVVGSTFVGNTIQDLTSTFYNAFTPTHSSGNIAIDTAGVATVV